MNRKSKRFTPSRMARWLVPVFLVGLTVLLAGTLILLFLSIGGLLP